MNRDFNVIDAAGDFKQTPLKLNCRNKRLWYTDQWWWTGLHGFITQLKGVFTALAYLFHGSNRSFSRVTADWKMYAIYNEPGSGSNFFMLIRVKRNPRELWVHIFARNDSKTRLRFRRKSLRIYESRKEQKNEKSSCTTWKLKHRPHNIMICSLLLKNEQISKSTKKIDKWKIGNYFAWGVYEAKLGSFFLNYGSRGVRLHEPVHSNCPIGHLCVIFIDCVQWETNYRWKLKQCTLGGIKFQSFSRLKQTHVILD